MAGDGRRRPTRAAHNPLNAPARSSCLSVLRPNLPASRAIVVVVINLQVVRCVRRGVHVIGTTARVNLISVAKAAAISGCRSLVGRGRRKPALPARDLSLSQCSTLKMRPMWSAYLAARVRRAGFGVTRSMRTVTTGIGGGFRCATPV